MAEQTCRCGHEKEDHRRGYAKCLCGISVDGVDVECECEDYEPAAQPEASPAQVAQEEKNVHAEMDAIENSVPVADGLRRVQGARANFEREMDVCATGAPTGDGKRPRPAVLLLQEMPERSSVQRFDRTEDATNVGQPTSSSAPQIPEDDEPDVSVSARHEILTAEYEQWESAQRAAGVPWRKIDSFTGWVYRRLAKAEASLAAERERTREEAAKVADVWAKSPSCDHHDSNPCCHVRTGAGIAAAIRALSRTEPEAQP